MIWRSRLVLLLAALAPGVLHAYIEFPYAAGFQTIRMPLLPRGSEPWKKGDMEIQFSAGWMNVWSIQSNRFILDGEEVRLNAGLSWGLSNRLRVGIVAPYVIQGGGILDRTIERFHSATLVTQGHRQEFPRNKFNVSYEPLGPYYPILQQLERVIESSYLPRKYPRSDIDPPVAYLPDPETSAFLGYDLDWFPEDSLDARTRSGPGALRIYADYRLPISSDYFEAMVFSVQGASEGSSATVAGNTGRSLSFSTLIRSEKKVHSYYWAAGLSYTMFEDRKFRLLELPAQQWAFRPRLGYLMEDAEIFGEYVFYSSPVKNWGKLSAAGHEIALGVSTELGSYSLEIAVIENFITYSTTPDVGFYASLRRQL